jgi:hypothetical protein
MSTHIDVDATDTTIKVHVTDDTGRDQRATIPRVPLTGSGAYVTFANALDVMMYTWEDRRGDERGQPLLPTTKCYARADD